MNLPRSLRLAIHAAAALLLLSCADSTPLGVAARSATAPRRADVAQAGSLLACPALPYDSVTRTVGPDGGTIQVGPHTLVIPAGALADSLSITAVAPSDSVRRVRFAPEGLVFSQPAQLTMSYAGCGLLGSLLPSVVYTSDLLTILEYLPSLNNAGAQAVTGAVRHFSDYAVAW